MLRLREKLISILFGLVLCVVTLELGLRLGGWAILSFQEHRNENVIREGGTLRILCLGESTTAHMRENSYPSQLQKILNKNNFGVNFIVINEGIRGITTRDILRQLPDNLNKYHPDMVITMMGINDSGILPYEDISLPGPLRFLRELKVYKLATLLWLHIANKLEAIQEKDSFSINTMLSTKFKKEEEKLQKATVTNPKDDKAYLLLGSYYLDSARFQEAEETFKKAIMVDPGNDSAYFGLGRCYAETARFKEAEEQFQKAVALNPQNYKAYTELGLYYLSEGRLQDIEDKLKKIIERDPSDGKAYSLLGQYYMYVGRNQEAEVMLKKAVKLNPINYRIICALGRYYSKAGKSREAEEAYDKLIAVKLDSSEAYISIGEGYQGVGRNKESEELLQRAVMLYPIKINVYHELARQYRKEGRSKEAENILKRAVVINPENREAYLSLGEFYINMGRWLEARRMLRKALAKTPGRYEIYKQFALYYRKIAAFQEAEEMLRKALEINPKDYGLYLDFGSCYEARGRFREAEEAYVMAITINPQQSCAYYRLGCLYEKTERFKEALQVWTKGLKVNPGNYEIYAKLMRFYFNQGGLFDTGGLPQRGLEKKLLKYSNYLGLGDYYRVDAQPQERFGLDWSKNRYTGTEGKLPARKSTIYNYRKLRAILEQKKIILVAVQYPCRKLKPLKDIFENKKGIIFVDNEAVFKTALDKGSYDEYFEDYFGGDFGHCTRKGNQLLAENIANAILKNIGSRDHD